MKKIFLNSKFNITKSFLKFKCLNFNNATPQIQNNYIREIPLYLKEEFNQVKLNNEKIALKFEEYKKGNKIWEIFNEVKNKIKFNYQSPYPYALKDKKYNLLEYLENSDSELNKNIDTLNNLIKKASLSIDEIEKTVNLYLKNLTQQYSTDETMMTQ